MKRDTDNVCFPMSHGNAESTEIRYGTEYKNDKSDICVTKRISVISVGSV